ncbi:MAG: N-acetylglucosamine-6-phosphate deacetylase [Acidobacteriia bacterium]|nr:N-acetylglucosamine-6-phosphate deacetylase [Terriglobia bacterium]
MIALTAAILFTPLERIEQPLLLLDDDVIVEVSSRALREAPQDCRVVDFGDAVLAPGFVDIHIHGGAGHDVMESDPAALPAVERLLARHGVSSYLPTTVTAPVDATLAALEKLADAIETAEDKPSAELRAQPLGIHLEGPFISHARRGVHPPENLLPPTVNAFERFWQAARGHIRVMTIAPELDGALEVIREAARRGVCVSLGHSDADLNSTRVAVAAGARHATHTFNAMRPLGHRDPGIVGEVLTNSRLTADIIADGIHLDPTIVQLFLQAKGPDAAVLITDATAATGMPEGRYRLGSFEVEVKDGKCLAGGKLAGSVLTMDAAVCNVMQFSQWSLQDAVRLATRNPARVGGLTGRGTLEAGASADIVVLAPEGKVIATIIQGRGI